MAALDHNVHQFRPLACRKDGQVLYKRQYSKRSKRWHAQPVKAPKKYSYVPKLLANILKNRKDFEGFVSAPAVAQEKDPKLISPTLCMTKTPPPTEEFIQQRLSRFAKKN